MSTGEFQQAPIVPGVGGVSVAGLAGARPVSGHGLASGPDAQLAGPEQGASKGKPCLGLRRAAFLGVWGPAPSGPPVWVCEEVGCPWGAGGGFTREALVSFRGRGPAGLGGWLVDPPTTRAPWGTHCPDSKVFQSGV